MSDPNDAIARLSTRLAELDERKYDAASTVSRLQKELAEVQADTKELDTECMAALDLIGEKEDTLKLAVNECMSLEQIVMNSKEESRRKQKRCRDFRQKSRQELLNQIESWSSFTGPEVGTQIVQLSLRQQVAQTAFTGLQQSTEESKKCMKAVQGAISNQKVELSRLEEIRAVCAVADEFVQLAGAVLSGTNHLLRHEKQLAAQVRAREQELAALRQRCAIVEAERSKFTETASELKAAQELRAKELEAAEQTLVDLAQVESEDGGDDGMSAPEPMSKGSGQAISKAANSEPNQHQRESSAVVHSCEQEQQNPGYPGFCNDKQNNQHAASAHNRLDNQAAQQPVGTTGGQGWSAVGPEREEQAPAAGPQSVPQHSVAHRPTCKDYTVEEPDDDEDQAQDAAAADAAQYHSNAGFQGRMPSNSHAEGMMHPSASNRWNSGAQDNATHVLMRKVECKRNSNGAPTAPKLRVRAVYTRIEPSGAHQTMTAERVMRADTNPQNSWQAARDHGQHRSHAHAHPAPIAPGNFPAERPDIRGQYTGGKQRAQAPVQPAVQSVRPFNTQQGPFVNSISGPTGGPQHRRAQDRGPGPPAQQQPESQQAQNREHQMQPNTNMNTSVQHTVPIVHHPPLCSQDKHPKTSGHWKQGSSTGRTYPAPVNSAPALQMLAAQGAQRSTSQPRAQATRPSNSFAAHNTGNSTTFQPSPQPSAHRKAADVSGAYQQAGSAAAPRTLSNGMGSMATNSQHLAHGSAAAQETSYPPQPVQKVMFQRQGNNTQPVVHMAPGAAAAERLVAATSSDTTGANGAKRKAGGVRVAPKKAPKRSSAQAKKSVPKFQFDVFGSKL